MVVAAAMTPPKFGLEQAGVDDGNVDAQLAHVDAVIAAQHVALSVCVHVRPAHRGVPVVTGVVFAGQLRPSLKKPGEQGALAEQHVLQSETRLHVDPAHRAVLLAV